MSTYLCDGARDGVGQRVAGAPAVAGEARGVQADVVQVAGGGHGGGGGGGWCGEI